MNRIIPLSVFWLLSWTVQAAEPPGLSQLRDGIGLTSPRAVDPCRPQVVLDDDDPTNDGLLEAFPADVCQSNGDSEQTAAQWAFLQKALLARSNEPLETARQIEKDRADLGRCADTACRVSTLKRQVAQYLVLWEKLPDPAGPAGVRLESWAYSSNKTIKRIRPLLAELERACFGKVVRYKDLQLSAAQQNIVVASCANGNQVAPLWLVSLATDVPTIIFASDTGSACYRMPATRDGYPDLGCPVKLSTRSTRTTLFRFGGDRYQPVLVLDNARSDLGELTLRYTLK